MQDNSTPHSWRSLLFVPGARPDRFDTACGSGADLVCIDLEDAVAPQDKDLARASTLSYLAAFERSDDRPLLGFRINAVATDAGMADLKALTPNTEFDFIMVPKVTTPADLDHVRDAIGCDRIIALIETSRGIQNAAAIADHDSVIAGVYGAVDLTAELGCALEWEAHLYCRSACVLAFSAAKKPLFDAPYLDVSDTDGLIQATQVAAGLGIHARTAIHPRQIDPIHEALQPSPEAVAKARRVLEAFEAAKGSAAVLDGRLIEKPVVNSALRILRRNDRDQ